MKLTYVVFSLALFSVSCKQETVTPESENIEIAQYASRNGDTLQLDTSGPCVLNISFIAPSSGTYTVHVKKGDSEVLNGNYSNTIEGKAAFNDLLRFWKPATEYGKYSWYITKAENKSLSEIRTFTICEKVN